MMNDEAVRLFYESINHNDIASVVKFLDPQVLRVEFEGLPMEVTLKGIKPVEDHFIKARATWAEGSCQPECIISKGNKVVALVYVKVRLKDKTEWAEGRVGDVFVFENGKVTEFRTFADTGEALKWAGVAES